MAKKTKSFLYGNTDLIEESWQEVCNNPSAFHIASGITKFLAKYEKFKTVYKGEYMFGIDDFFRRTNSLLVEMSSLRKAFGLKNNDADFYHDAIVGDILGATGISKDDCGWDALFCVNGITKGFLENKNIDILAETWEGNFFGYNLFKNVELASSNSVISLAVWEDIEKLAFIGVIPKNKETNCNEAGKHLLISFLKKAKSPTDKFPAKVNISAILKFGGFFVAGPSYTVSDVITILTDRHPSLEKNIYDKNKVYSFDEFMAKVNLYENF
jgi:hypothetical protein